MLERRKFFIGAIGSVIGILFGKKLVSAGKSLQTVEEPEFKNCIMVKVVGYNDKGEAVRYGRKINTDANATHYLFGEKGYINPLQCRPSKLHRKVLKETLAECKTEKERKEFLGWREEVKTYKYKFNEMSRLISRRLDRILKGTHIKFTDRNSEQNKNTIKDVFSTKEENDKFMDDYWNGMHKDLNELLKHVIKI